MAGYLLKLLFLSGKYLTHTARKTLLHMIHKSIEFQKNLCNQYEKTTCMVGPEENMLKVINNRLEPLNFQQENHVQRAGHGKLKPGLNFNLISMETPLTNNFKLDPVTTDGHTITTDTMKIEHLQIGKSSELLGQALSTTKHSCLTSLQNCVKNFDVSIEQIALLPKITNYKEKSRNNKKSEELKSQIKSFVTKNVHESNNKISQVEHEVPYNADDSSSMFKKTEVNLRYKQQKQFKPGNNCNSIKVETQLQEMEKNNLKQGTLTSQAEPVLYKTGNNVSHFRRSLKKYFIANLKQRESSKLLTPINCSHMQQSSQQKETAREIPPLFNKACNIEKQSGNIFWSTDNDNILNSSDKVKHCTKENCYENIQQDILNQDILHASCSSEFTLCRCVVYEKESKVETLGCIDITTCSEEKYGNIGLKSTLVNAKYKITNAAANTNNISNGKTRSCVSSSLAGSYSHYDSHINDNNSFYQSNCHFCECDKVKVCPGASLCKQQKNETTNFLIALPAIIKDKSSFINAIDGKADYIFLSKLYQQLLANNDQFVFNYLYCQNPHILLLALFDLSCTRTESKCSVALPTEATTQNTLKLKEAWKHPKVTFDNQRNMEASLYTINNTINNVVKSENARLVKTNYSSAIKTKRQLDHKIHRFLNTIKLSKLNSETPERGSSLHKNSCYFKDVTKKLKKIKVRRDVVADMNLKNIWETCTKLKVKTVGESSKLTNNFKTNSIELHNISKHITDFNFMKYLLLKPLKCIVHIPFIYLGINYSPTAPLCLKIIIPNSENFVAPRKCTRQFHSTNGSAEPPKPVSVIQKTEISENSLRLSKPDTQTYCLLHNEATPLQLVGMRATENTPEQTASTNVQYKETENSAELKGYVKEINLSQNEEHIKGAVKLPTNNSSEQAFKPQVPSNTELRKKLPVREMEATQLEVPQSSKPRDFCEEFRKSKNVPSENLIESNNVDTVRSLQVANVRTNIKDSDKQLKWSNKINLNIKSNSSLQQLTQMQTASYTMGTEWLAENYKIGSGIKLLTVLEQVSLLQTLSTRMNDIDFDDINERSSILEINKRVFDNMENDIRKIKIIDTPKKDQETTGNKNPAAENVTKRIPTKKDLSSFKKEIQASKIKRFQTGNFHGGISSLNETTYFDSVHNQTELTNIQTGIYEKQSNSVCNQSITTTLPIKKVKLSDTLQRETNNRRDQPNKNDIFKIIRTITSKVEEPCKCLEIIESTQKQALALLYKQLALKICITKQGKADKSQIEYQTLTNTMESAKKSVVLDWDTPSCYKPATFITQHKGENVCSKKQTESENKPISFLVDKNTGLTSANEISSLLLSRNSQTAEDFKRKLEQNKSQNSNLEEQLPRAKYIYNKPPLYFKKSCDILILPEMTFWNVQPKVPLNIICKNFNKQTKTTHLSSKKYRYETKEVNSTKGKKIKITCLISDNDM